jgi:hypothetical protein
MLARGLYTPVCWAAKVVTLHVASRPLIFALGLEDKSEVRMTMAACGRTIVVRSHSVSKFLFRVSGLKYGCALFLTMS